MIHTIENSRKIILGRVGLLLLGTGMYWSSLSFGLIGGVITTFFALDIYLTLKEEKL
jgi:hypothetical protein